MKVFKYACLLFLVSVMLKFVLNPDNDLKGKLAKTLNITYDKIDEFSNTLGITDYSQEGEEYTEFALIDALSNNTVYLVIIIVGPVLILSRMNLSDKKEVKSKVEKETITVSNKNEFSNDFYDEDLR